MNKDVQIRFRIDNDTKKIVEKEAGKYKNRSEFLRNLLEGFTPVGKQKEVMIELEKIRMEIHKIGVNINQITKNNNSQLYSEQDKKSLEISMRNIVRLEDELLKKIGVF